MRDTDPPIPREQHEFAARLDVLPEVDSLARGFCARHALDPELANRLALVLEELVTNTVRHGHGGDCDRTILVTLRVEHGDVVLVYEDDAPPFDPVTAAEHSARALDDSTLERRVGGLGLPLLRGMARTWRYRRVDEHNRIDLWIGPPPADDDRGARPR